MPAASATAGRLNTGGSQPRVGDVEGVDQPAIDLIGEHDRGDEVLRAGALGLRDREAGRDMVAGMTGKASDIDVVEIVIAEGGAVGEGRKVGRGAPVGADDGGDAADRERDVAADADRPLVEGGDAAAERIDDMRFDPFDGRGIDIVIAQAVGIGGEPFRKRMDGLLRRRPGRRALRARRPGRDRKRGSGRCQTQKSLRGSFIGVSSMSDDRCPASPYLLQTIALA